MYFMTTWPMLMVIAVVIFAATLRAQGGVTPIKGTGVATTTEHQAPSPTLSDHALVEYWKSQYQLQKATADQYLLLLNAFQQQWSSQLNGPKQDAAIKEAALKSECGTDSSLTGLDTGNPKCVPNPNPPKK